MRYHLLILILSSSLLIQACGDSNSNEKQNTFTGEFETAADIQAGTLGYTFFNLRTGSVVADSNSTNWDLGFKDAGFEIFIITNSGSRGPGEGGGILLDVAFDEVTEIPSDDQFTVETSSSYAINPAPTTDQLSGWWIYTATFMEPNHAVLPKTPHTILVRNADGNSYSKVEIQSYYQGNPNLFLPQFADPQNRPASGYFTFKYEVIN